MAKQIIVLGVTSNIGGEYSVNVAFWYPVASGEEFPLPGRSSEYKGATLDELTALRVGSVIEEVRGYIVPSSYTVAQVQAFLLTIYQAKVAYINTKPAVGNFYGYNFDGSAWNNIHG